MTGLRRLHAANKRLSPHAGCSRGPLAIFLCACAPLAASIAQQTTPTSGGSASQLQEIVVTAEKRESTVLKTPISITAVSGQELLNRGVSSFAELAQDTPGVSLRTSGPGMTEVEIR